MSTGKTKANKMNLWNACSRTNPKHTKQVNNGRFKFTCVDPQYQSEQATEQFGPYGKGWGIENCKFTMIAEGSDVQSMMLEADFFYVLDSKRYSFPYAVDLKYRHGDDICKKLMTSMQSKCLSKLGFASDVYLGQFDDTSYVKDQEIRNYRPDKKRDWLQEVIAKIESCKKISDLEMCKSRVISLVENHAVSDGEADSLHQAIYAKHESLSK